MYEHLANAFVIAVYAYVALGALTGVLIVSGLGRVDSEARGSGAGFRIIIFPGIIALWPLMLKRFVQGRGEPPTQKDPHR